MILYLPGSPSVDGEHILCPLSSSALMFVIRYCKTTVFELVFVPDSDDTISMCCTFNRNIFTDLSVMFMSWAKLPAAIRNVSLPSLLQPELSLVRSGLCVLLRHIIKESHSLAPHLHVIDLLGFREGSMKMCTEVSGFTKLCEVELPLSVSHLMIALKDVSLQHKSESDDSQIRSRDVIIPNTLTKLDSHFRNKCRVHNDNKRRREELIKIKKHFSKSFRNKISLIEDTTYNSIQKETGNKKETMLVHKHGDHSSLQNDHLLCNDSFVSTKHSAHIASENVSFRVEIEKVSSQDSHLHIDHMTHLPHGIRRLKVDKQFDISADLQNGCSIISGDREVVSGFERPDSYQEEKSFECLSIDGFNSSGKSSECVKISGCSPSIKSSMCVSVDGCNSSKKSSKCVNIFDCNPSTTTSILDEIAVLVEKLTFLDIEYEHTYSEGSEMTLADLILFVYIYHLLEALDFNCISLTDHVPSILQWANHMTSVPTVVDASQRSGWKMNKFANGFHIVNTRDGYESSHWSKHVVFIKDIEIMEEEMELSRCARMKHKALKPEVTQILDKFEKANIRPVTGSHCCGDHVEVDWDSLPAAVHPKEGDVPKSRTKRKCQQLENLATAMQTIAKPGDILVDFCSGGGHLGVLMAYMLPDCQVYLVENKEESLLKASSRLESLDLHNVTMYQCNLDYFRGTFNVGVCLHACGSATDMVLKLCLDSNASFVICPCCYGSIQKTHILCYPQSQHFETAGITYKEFLTLGHAADQTELNTALEEQGRLCMNLVDTDRAQLARELGYDVTLCSLKPLSCTPKNNLLFGILNK